MSAELDAHDRHSPAATENGSGHSGHGWLAMLACCIPMIVVFALVALRVI